MIRRILKAIANKLNFSLLRQETMIQLINKNYGAKFSAETFGKYIERYSEFNNNDEIKKFIAFFIKNWRLSSSQWGQDIFVMYIAKLKRNGKYLEIGGADGYTGSNTISLNRHLDWDGVLVEPNNELFSILKNTRKKDIVLNAALSPSDSKNLSLRKFGQLSALVGYEGEDMHFKKRMSSKSFQRINGISLSSILTEYKFDYFSLDIEGAELSILESVKWEKVNKPFIITVEFNDSVEKKNKIINLLEKQGYVNYFPNHNWLTRCDLWFSL